jgi:hypothetical protein
MLSPELKSLLDQLWKQYSERNEDVLRLHNLLVERGENVINDHIALRTFNHPKVNIARLSQAILRLGYQAKTEYHFEEKKLRAVHFVHPSEEAPLIFISELLTEQFSADLQETVNQICEQVDEDAVVTDAFLYSGRPWDGISFDTYEKLREESEYAAWLYTEGYRANHFTVYVNELKGFEDIRALNDFIRENGFIMNNPENEVQGSKELCLEQSSIKASLVEADFVEGTKTITGCYYEFAQRYPMADGTIFRGFVAASADKIFESTDLYKK